MGSLSSPVRFEISGEDVDTASPDGSGGGIDSTHICDLCQRRLPQYDVIYMYRDRAFCSSECRSDKINRNNVNAVDAVQEAEVAWLEKFRLRKNLNKENVKVLKETELKGLQFAIGAYTARRRRSSSPFQVIRAQKCTKKRTHREKKKLKSSNEHLLSPRNSQSNLLRQSDSADFSVQQRQNPCNSSDDHIIFLSSFDNSSQDRDQITARRSVQQEERSRRTDSVEWTILLTTLALESIAATFDQVSSPSKPYYALMGVIVSFIALVICVAEIVYKDRKAKITWMRKDRVSWHHPDMPFDSLVDCFGLACAMVQCIFSSVEYAYFVRHANNPIKFCILPVIFVMCLVFSRLNHNCGRIFLQQAIF